MFKVSFLITAKVTSVMPRLGLRSQYCPVKRVSRTLKYISGVEASNTCLRTHGIAQEGAMGSRKTYLFSSAPPKDHRVIADVQLAA